MDKINTYFKDVFSSVSFWRIIFGILALEILSFGGYTFPFINTLVFAALIITTFIVSLKRLQYGIYILLTELVIGSKGYLFEIPVFGFPLSIRIGLFATVFLAYLIWIIRDRAIYFFQWKLWKPYFALGCMIIVGVVSGWLHHNNFANIFFDANGYLYIAFIGPVTQAIRSRKDIQQLFGVLLASATAVIIKTLLLLFLFSKSELWLYSASGIYRWIRDTGVGEITRRPTGFYRIFFQSHIYSVIVFFITGIWLAMVESNQYKKIKQKTPARTIYILFALSLLTVFLVYSRSFWVGSIATLGIAFIWLWIYEKFSFKRLGILTILCIATFIIDYGIALGIVNFPLPGTSRIDASSILTERTSNLGSEDAASSRISLLKPLWNASLKNPVLGSGLGATVIYKSSDPRILEQAELYPDGWYTTFAFEWGYLDLWLKFGLIGLVVYGWLIISIFLTGYRKLKTAPQDIHIETLAVLCSILAILGTHFFTPYLNHPLGIGWIVIASVIIAFQSSQSTSEQKVPQ